MTDKKKDAKKKKKVASSEEFFVKSREIFLHEEVKHETMVRVIKEIKYLNSLNSKPITLWLNTPGGSCTNGMALVNIIRASVAPIITVINMEVASMGSHISVAGDVRKMVHNGLWMAHDAKGGTNGDYFGKTFDRVIGLKKLYEILEDNYRANTKLTEKELEKAQSGELWYSAEDCLKKGIIDEIIYPD